MSSKLTAHLSLTPPNKLYHYTSTEAFRSIVEKRKIWASDAFYVNDNQEVLHAIELLRSTCKAFESHRKGNELAFLKKLQQELHFQKINQSHVFTASFSESRDQLSQWRAYSKAGGYAVSFNGEALLHIAEHQKFLLTKCLYKEQDKTELIQEFLEDKLQTVGEESIDLLAVITANDFLEIAAMMKHEGFAEENEWRLISRPNIHQKGTIRFRSTSKYLIPYVEIDIDINATTQKKDSRDYIGIDEVLVGPAPEPELSWRSCMQLLEDRNVYYEQITPSGTPYRAN